MKNLRPTATLAAIISVVLLGAEQLGVEMTPVIASALVIFPAAIVSYLKPRWARDRGIFTEHPAALSGSAATLLVWVGNLLGAEISTEAAIAIVGGITALVGIATPRQT
jgi:hypothetical protein